MVNRFLRAILALVLINVGLFAATVSFNKAQATQSLPPQSASSELLLLRVDIAPADVARLLATGVDVLEARDKGDLLVLGNETIAAQLRARGFSVEIAQQNSPARNAFAPFTYNGGYRTVAEHEQHLADVAATHPTLAQIVTYGQSWRKQQGQADGHDLKAICITQLRPGDCALSPNTDKPRFFLMAAIHARELSTSEMAWRWIDWLVQGYGVDAEITALVNSSEMWVVPVANPDGRARVEQGGDAPYLQRKNLHANDPSNCQQPGSSGLWFDQDGIDLNRNADFKWGNAGTTLCEATYQGANAASEPEQQALEQLMRNLFQDQRDSSDLAAAPITTTGAMLTLHSYSDLVIFPWGWTECSGTACNSTNQAPNDVGLRTFAFRMSYHNGYSTGQPSELLYAASGTTDDWAYGQLGIAAATFEIGPSSDSDDCGARFTFTAFTPPYTCQDTRFWPLNKGAFLTAAKLARQPFALSAGPVITGVRVNISASPDISATDNVTITIEAQARDDVFGTQGVRRPASQPISAAEVYLDAPPWLGGSPILMDAGDGIFDTVSETVRTTQVISAVMTLSDTHLIYVRAQDNTGAWGPVSAAWLKNAPVATPTPTPPPTPAVPANYPRFLPLIFR